MNSSCKRKSNKNFLKYALLLGGVAIILSYVGKNILKKKHIQNDYPHDSIDCYISRIKDFDDLESLVYSDGTQVILDEITGEISIVFINADGKAEIFEVSDSDLNELISTKVFDTVNN